MNTDRRSFLAGAVALAACHNGEARGSNAAPLRPEDFGARGDGSTNDTAALQRCLAAAPAGAVVQLRSGAVYRVDTNYRPTSGTFGGLRLKTGQVLDLNGAELKALPSKHAHGAVVQAYGVSGWEIRGAGRITGERSSHAGQGGEWGMGVLALSSNDWTIGPNVEINDCWGDGLYVSSMEGGDHCLNFLIDRVHIWNCRRNGISIVAGRNEEIRSANIHDINGTSPYAAIDLEPDHSARPNRNIRISGGKIRNVGAGICVTVANENVVITGMEIEARGSGVLIGNGARNLKIVSNPQIRTLAGGEEGAAIWAVANPSTIEGLHIIENDLSGGGGFVVDLWGQGYRDLIVSRNRISATNKGTQGIARVGAGFFTDNVCLLGRNTGKEGDYFIHLQTVSYGRNVYRSESPHSMYSAIRGGREIAPDSFESPKLIKYSEAL